MGSINLTHPTSADLLDDAVMPEGATDEVLHFLGSYPAMLSQKGDSLGRRWSLIRNMGKTVSDLRRGLSIRCLAPRGETVEGRLLRHRARPCRGVSAFEAVGEQPAVAAVEHSETARKICHINMVSGDGDVLCGTRVS